MVGRVPPWHGGPMLKSRNDTLGAPQIIVLALVSAAVIVGGVFWAIGKNKQAAGHAATRFAAALVDNDPDAAPKGSPDYIKGTRAYFGAVTGARLIGTHNERADANTNSSRTYPVADVLLRSARGPAVIELAFDNGGIGSEKVTGIHELRPADAPKLPARIREQLASAFAKRGGIAADADTLRHATAATRRAAEVRQAAAIRKAAAPASALARAARVAQPAPAEPTPAMRAARSELRCVQRARGDVTKLLACSR